MKKETYKDICKIGFEGLGIGFVIGAVCGILYYFKNSVI